MNKVSRLIYKAKQLRNADPEKNYIAWATVHPKGSEYIARIMYFGDTVDDTKRLEETAPFTTRNEAADYVGRLADEHGQEEVMIIHFNF